MPFIGSFSGSKLVRGSGAYHPGIVTTDISPSVAVNSIAATSTASTTATGTTNRLAGLTVSSVNTQPRYAYDPFQNGAVVYAITGNAVATGTITRVTSANVYISFTTGGFGNLYAGQPFYIGGPGAVMGYLSPSTYYIVSINSGSGYITLATSYANYQSSTVASFASSSAGDASGYTWTDTYPTFTAGGGLPPGMSFSNGTITGAYTMNQSVNNGLNFDANAGGVAPLGSEPVRSLNNIYAIQIAATNARGQAGITELFNVQVAIPYEFRQILTTCYVLGGYKLSTPWSNVNKATAATDTNVNAGNMSHSQGYTTGPCGWNYAYVMGASDTYSGAGTNVCAWNMRTDTNRTINYNTTWLDSVTAVARLQQENYYCWIAGSGTLREFVFATETYNGVPANTTGTGASEAAGSHEVRGIWQSTNASWQFATRTGTTRTAAAISGSNMYRIFENKNPSTYQWANNGSNVMRYTSFPNDTTTDSAISEITTSNGSTGASESNQTTAQDWGYCIGWYDGSHVANTYKMVYATQVQTWNPNGMQYQGQAGCSSGWGAWRD